MAQSHAWIEFFSPTRGWIPFDPTHDREIDERYVTVGHGRSYEDVPPNKGVFRGNARETLTAEVYTRVSAHKDVSTLREEIEAIDLPVFQEIPDRSRISRGIVTDDAIVQQQQEQQQYGEHMRINRARLAASMDALGRIGETPRGGLTRLALTDEDRRGRDLLVGWMREAGLTVTRGPDGQHLRPPSGHGRPAARPHGLARRLGADRGQVRRAARRPVRAGGHSHPDGARARRATPWAW